MQNELTMYIYFQCVFIHFSNITCCKIGKIKFCQDSTSFISVVLNIIFIQLIVCYVRPVQEYVTYSTALYFMTIILQHVYQFFTNRRNNLEKCITFLRINTDVFKTKNYNLFTRKHAFVINISFSIHPQSNWIHHVNKHAAHDKMCDLHTRLEILCPHLADL